MFVRVINTPLPCLTKTASIIDFNSIILQKLRFYFISNKVYTIQTNSSIQGPYNSSNLHFDNIFCRTTMVSFSYGQTEFKYFLSIKPFQANDPYLFSLKTSKNQRLSDYFQREYKWYIGIKWVNSLMTEVSIIQKPVQ